MASEQLEVARQLALRLSYARTQALIHAFSAARSPAHIRAMLYGETATEPTGSRSNAVLKTKRLPAVNLTRSLETVPPL